MPASRPAALGRHTDAFPDPAVVPHNRLTGQSQNEFFIQFENACLVSGTKRWGEINDPGRLFVNISADVLVKAWRVYGAAPLLELLGSLRVLPRMLVLEITEHERVADMDRLARVVDAIRRAGVSLALDDFGDSRSSLRLWSQLKPEFVKIDKYFTKDISQHADKLKIVLGTSYPKDVPPA